MLNRSLFCAMLWAAMSIPAASAEILDYSKYPDQRGQWERFVVRGVAGQPSFDQTKPWGRGQQAPLTPECQAIHDASLGDQAAGGLGGDLVESAMPEQIPIRCVMMRGGTSKGVFLDDRNLPKDVSSARASSYR
jgi:hypothetical protein